jgi:MOSC domain-containing protein YiiM
MPPLDPQGTVLQLNRKSEVPGEHGLPKKPVPTAHVTKAGLEGDFNRYRREEKHDDPDMAVLIVPLEVIHALNAEGWPVRPGDLGENITSSGLPNDAFRPDRRVRVGSVLLQVSKPCDPCNNLYLLPYIGESRGPAFLRTTLGRRGWYCRVLEEGTVSTGDPIRFDSS